MDPIPGFKTWEIIVGWLVLAFGGGIFLGKHHAKLNTHQQYIDDCHMEDVMTVDKCRDFHDRTQVSTVNQLSAIQENQREMRLDMRKYQVQLSAAIGRIENIAGRLERE